MGRFWGIFLAKFSVLALSSSIFVACNSNHSTQGSSAANATKGISTKTEIFASSLSNSDPKAIQNDEISALKAEGLIDEADEALLSEIN